jgi:hypothetical protein
MAVQRHAVDLSGYPNLVAILLGMQVRTVVGIKTLFGFGPKIAKSAANHSDGLLLHEAFLWPLFPVQSGVPSGRPLWVLSRMASAGDVPAASG